VVVYVDLPVVIKEENAQPRPVLVCLKPAQTLTEHNRLMVLTSTTVLCDVNVVRPFVTATEMMHTPVLLLPILVMNMLPAPTPMVVLHSLVLTLPLVIGAMVQLNVNAEQLIVMKDRSVGLQPIPVHTRLVQMLLVQKYLPASIAVNAEVEPVIRVKNALLPPLRVYTLLVQTLMRLK